MKILIANIGSTSLKYRLFDMASGEIVLAQGGIERVEDHGVAIEDCLAELKAGGQLEDVNDLAAVGFKPIIAKGVSGCVEMDEKVLTSMESLSGVAPAHNPPYINGVRLFGGKLPGTPMVGLFETSFYQWMEEAQARYAVPQDWYELGVRRWGFHGASHKFIAERSAEMLDRGDVAERVRRLYVDGPDTKISGDDLRVISCHLGGSSSITGIRSGVAIGNSMGLSPQSGLPQNNRVGDLDSMALPFVMRELGISADEAERIMAKESGLLGLSGVSNDVRDISEAASGGNERAQLALDVLAASARQWIGKYYLELNGLDALVFTAGIAENDDALRRAICRNLENLGIELEDGAPEKNENGEAFIQSENSKVKVIIIPTNEELVIAREVKRFLENR